MNRYDPHKFPYEWYLRDGYPAKGIENHGCTVFGTFICGGGSSMGYKLAGFHHLGGVELDPKVAAIYKANHNPEYLYIEDIRDFNKREDLPWDLYNLDLLDGSPPCSTFSTAGSRDKAWGKEKKFAEGQKKQTLDDLVFVYCDTILKLKPKCFVLENVSGLVKGNAKSYAKRIVNYLTENSYDVQVFLLNAATMGVPQKRERVFFIGHRREYKLPKLVLDFNEQPILFGEIIDDNDTHDDLTDEKRKLWRLRKPTDTSFADINQREFGKGTFYTHTIAHRNKVSGTIISGDGNYTYDYPRHFNDLETKLVSTFPVDYYNGEKKTTVLLWNERTASYDSPNLISDLQTMAIKNKITLCNRNITLKARKRESEKARTGSGNRTATSRATRGRLVVSGRSMRGAKAKRQRTN